MTEQQLLPDELKIAEIIDAVSCMPGTADRLVLKQLLVKTAYAAGADAELEACCSHVEATVRGDAADALHRVRRPKALTKQQELKTVLRDLKVSASKATWGDFEPLYEAIQNLEQLIEDLEGG